MYLLIIYMLLCRDNHDDEEVEAEAEEEEDEDEEKRERLYRMTMMR